jgi:6-pyruvoyltetrahydropterin/6-carboxytetrahydropterin synthase
MEQEYRETVKSSLTEILGGCLRLLASVETRLGPQPSTADLPTAEEPMRATGDRDWSSAIQYAASAFRPAGRPATAEAQAPLERRLRQLSLVVSPVTRLNLARELVPELENQPTVTRVTLTDFEADKATFKLETIDPQQLIRSLMVWAPLRARSVQISADRIEIVLPEALEPTWRIEAVAPPAPPPVPPLPPVAVAPAPFVPPPTHNGGALTVDIDVFFNARHFVVLDGHQGPVHPHSWRVQARISGSFGEEHTVLMPFAEAKRLVQEVVSKYNDVILNTTEPFDQVQPTTENIAATFYKEVKTALGALPVRLVSLSVWESPTNRVTYSEH